MLHSLCPSILLSFPSVPIDLIFCCSFCVHPSRFFCLSCILSIFLYFTFTGFIQHKVILRIFMCVNHFGHNTWSRLSSTIIFWPSLAVGFFFVTCLSKSPSLQFHIVTQEFHAVSFVCCFYCTFIVQDIRTSHRLF